MKVGFWFDPLCPWAWISSQWLVQVQQVRGIEPCWRLMSQAILYEDQDLTPEQQDTVRQMIKPLRVLAAAEQRYDGEAVPLLYAALGVRFHDRGLRHRLDVLAETVGDALRAAGLDPALAAAMESTEFDGRIRRSHEEAVSRVGPDAGTPVIEVDGPAGRVAFFGPVVSPAPRGEAAGRLWDGLVLIAGTPGFSELKRSRTQGPIFD
ncbi:disulfide bond formation protein DsbA [Micromonospora sp. NPDC023814]|uniref:mycothiol-dependent nitroreductase Rv2466c family protein n=1 Tax=Micromonospora sp. NPDC023814 TaxID=3154596 RepID=UPI0033D9E181